MRRKILHVVLAALAVYAVTGAAVALGYRRGLYPAPAVARAPAADGARVVRFEGGLALHAEAPPGAPTVVHFHGNGEQLADLDPLVAAYQTLGLGVYAVEYPGYGLLADEDPSEESLYAAAEAALLHLRGALGVPRERTVLAGQSLGSGVAAEMALRGHGDRLVLLSPYTSIVEMVRRFAPLWPVGLLIADRFDTLSKAPRLTLPVLIVHGDADQLIPVEMARELGRTFPRAELSIVPGAGHNDLLGADGGEALRTIARFSFAPAG